jgi:hypothetical protein
MRTRSKSDDRRAPAAPITHVVITPDNRSSYTHTYSNPFALHTPFITSVTHNGRAHTHHPHTPHTRKMYRHIGHFCLPIISSATHLPALVPATLITMITRIIVLILTNDHTNTCSSVVGATTDGGDRITPMTTTTLLLSNILQNTNYTSIYHSVLYAYSPAQR